MVTYCRLTDGSWGIKGDSSEIWPGEPVVVTKRDGTTVVEIVKDVLWRENGIACATVVRRES